MNLFLSPLRGAFGIRIASLFADNEASLMNYRGEVLANNYRYKDMLKSDEFLSINSVLVEIKFHDRSSKDGLEAMISSGQAPVSKRIFDHLESKSLMSELCSANPVL